MKVTIEGYTTLTGNPEAILQLIRDSQIFNPDMSTEDCIESIQHTAWRCFGTNLEVEGDTTAERAESLLRAMEENNMIKIEEE